jgi:hypothetical protein
MRVLVACERSGVVRQAFAARGHDAWSCDLVPSLVPGKHIQADVRSVLAEGWDLLIAHPPCQYLSAAGARWWSKPGYADLQNSAMDFFLELFNAPVPRVCVENPRGLPCRAFRSPDQVVHPYYFGEPFRKRTCLWLRNLPLLLWFPVGSLFQTAVPAPPPVSYDASGKARHFTDGAVRCPVARSLTFSSIAAAMAAQWG